eukprot:gene9157-10745_t
MKQQLNLKIIAATLGLSVCVVTILLKYFATAPADGIRRFSTAPPTISPDKKYTEPPVTPRQEDNVNNNNVENGGDAAGQPAEAAVLVDAAPVSNNTREGVPAPTTLEMADIEDLNKSCGFCRPEMTDADRKPPANSIHEYGRHYFICSGMDSAAWPSKFFTASQQLTDLSVPIKAHDRDQLVPSIFNGIDMPSANPETFDLLVFPENIKLVGMTGNTLESVLSYFASNKSITDDFPSNVNMESISDKYIFVCAHAQKDARCGYCGPILVDQLREEIESRGLSKEVKVFGTSHVGGHKFAGNVLVFPQGHWYGYATPSDVPEILDSALSGEVIQRLHRGSMGQRIIKEEKKEKKHHHHKKQDVDVNSF